MFRYLFYNIVSISFVVLAGLLAYWGKPGWGWVVFAAVITTVVPSSQTSKKNKNNSKDSNDL